MNPGQDFEPSKIRILLISTGSGIGGEESFTSNLAESLLRRRWDVRVAAKSPVHQDELQRRGLPVVPIAASGRNPWKILQGAFTLARYAAQENIHILHAQSAAPAAMCVLARRLGLFKRPRPVLIWQDHGITYYRLVAAVANHLDMTIPVSDYEKNKLIQAGLKPHRVTRIHNGIDLARFARPADERARQRLRIRNQLGLDNDVPIAGYIGRLSPEKAPEDFVRAYPFVREQLPDARFLVVGDGVMRPLIERLIREFGAEKHIIMTGFRRDIPDLLSTLDTLVQVSHADTFSLTTLEAMAMCVPCIVTDVGGFPEQVTDGQNGRVLPDRQPQSIARAIVDILSDPAKRQAYGEAGYQRVCDYLNLERMVDDIEKMYRNLLAYKSGSQ
jgi:glycosyltransferase involved in cell wall biosynthesis